MAFTFNPAGSQQLSLWDSYESLTEREKRFLDKSWAKVFARDIFPKIDEAPYAVLYRDAASRPNVPVNVIIGALIIKEYLGMSDEDICSSLMFDVRFQYALCTTSFVEQPLSVRTLARFRERCTTYEKRYGVDLLQNTIDSLIGELEKLEEADHSFRKLDRLTVAANIRRLSRLELLYTCVANLACAIAKKDGAGSLPERLQHYTREDDREHTIYLNRSEETADKISVILEDAAALLELCGAEYDESSEYQLLIRVLKEQKGS